MAPHRRTPTVRQPAEEPGNPGPDHAHAGNRQVPPQLISAREKIMSKQIQDAYIVAATRLPVAKKNGMFKNVRPDDMLAHVIKAVVAQVPGIDPARIGDVIVGCAMPEAEQGMNVARIGLLLAGLPITVPGITINRFCSSGLQAVADAAYRIR